METDSSRSALKGISKECRVVDGSCSPPSSHKSSLACELVDCASGDGREYSQAATDQYKWAWEKRDERKGEKGLGITILESGS